MEAPPFVWAALPDLAAILARPEQYTGTGRRADEITAYIGHGSGVQFPSAPARAMRAAARGSSPIVAPTECAANTAAGLHVEA